MNAQDSLANGQPTNNPPPAHLLLGGGGYKGDNMIKFTTYNKDVIVSQNGLIVGTISKCKAKLLKKVIAKRIKRAGVITLAKSDKGIVVI